jgi:hypothetical protein
MNAVPVENLSDEKTPSSEEAMEKYETRHEFKAHSCLNNRKIRPIALGAGLR